jgi:hypothetical protein
MRRVPVRVPKTEELSIAAFLDVVTCGTWRKPAILRWPPDVFAIVGALLHWTGAYTNVVDRWPQGKRDQSRSAGDRWKKRIRSLADRWRTQHPRQAPAEVQRWWRELKKASRTPLLDVAGRTSVVEKLLLLASTADEASHGVGIPPRDGEFEKVAFQQLQADAPGGATVCVSVPPTYVRVLPKLHTPQTGMTLRSLTHHLALCVGGQPETRWHYVGGNQTTTSLTLLVVPWPVRLTRSCFRPVRPAHGRLFTMPKEYGFFEYSPPPAPFLGEWVQALIEETKRKGMGPVDGVILPELACDEQAYRSVKEAALRSRAFLVAGVYRPRKGVAGENIVLVDFPVGPMAFTSIEQAKHHRWKIEGNQISQYGLANVLKRGMRWWEYAHMPSRRLAFITVRQWLTVCPLICEDLARQEPIGDIVRAVGPNLVIALLMDGPQLASRWSARYATVLADDPGTSVLTVTNLGMAMASRGPKGRAGNRTVALWKDAWSGESREIDCTKGSSAFALRLTDRSREEWTADGRGDRGQSRFPKLERVQPLDAQYKTGRKS